MKFAHDLSTRLLSKLSSESLFLLGAFRYPDIEKILSEATLVAWMGSTLRAILLSAGNFS